jgi:putative flippase GtrA
MVEKIKQLCVKYEEIIVYLIVGVINTIVSWAACFLVELFLDPDISWQNFVINTVGWVAGVIFGYFANRKYVFKSTNPEMLKEFMGFAGGRVSTWIMDIVLMFVLVNLIHMDYWIAKIFISSVLVMIANYLLSKFFVLEVVVFEVSVYVLTDKITILRGGVVETFVTMQSDSQLRPIGLCDCNRVGVGHDGIYRRY